MTKQAKNARNLARAKEITRMHKNGEKGPSKTQPKHGKKWTYRSNPAAMKALAEFLRETAVPKEKTSGQAILRSAGKAAQVDMEEID